jgi:hypothetical protein
MFKDTIQVFLFYLILFLIGAVFFLSAQFSSPANMLQEIQRSVMASVRASKTCVGPIIHFRAAAL